MLDLMKGHDKAIVGLEVIDASLVAALPELKVIGKRGVGLDKIDFEALTRHGVRFGWTGGVNRRSVAELALGFMLALTTHTKPVVIYVHMGASCWKAADKKRLEL